MIRQMIIFSGLLVTLLGGNLWAGLMPGEILLIVNRNVPDGAVLADNYRRLRQVPEANLLVVDLPVRESCSRQDYDDLLVTPLKALLRAPEYHKIRCLLLFYGIPLRIQSDVQEQNTQPTHSQKLRSETGAALDSELVLALVDGYSVAGWQANPYYSPAGRGRHVSEGLLVSRLDAARPETVTRMMADSMSAEREGLYGTAYFDARWPQRAVLQNAYQRYDSALHEAANLTRQISRLAVVLEDSDALLTAGPDAAVYCGWYRLAAYQDVFTWRPGAVAYHVASGECASLRNPGNHGWCKGILEAGGAATLGPVAEPYLTAFPRPDLFFSYLFNGHYTLVESYFFSLPHVSWQMILLGDPLYRPFRNH